MQWFLAIALSGCLVRAADPETPSVFRPSTLALAPANAPSPAPPAVEAWIEAAADGGITQLRLRRGSGPVETLDSWSTAPTFSPAAPASVAYPDGTTLVAYRRPEAAGSAVVLVRQVGGRWQRPQVLAAESWRPSGDITHAGPQLARAGARAVVTWYTEQGDEPQVLSMGSSDAGARFAQPERIDLGAPAGGVDVLMLHDGTQLVTWRERPGADPSQPGGLYLRRSAAYGATLPPALLVTAGQLGAGSRPRLGLVRDEAELPVQLTVSYPAAGQPAVAKTLLVTLPDPEVLAAADNACGCAPNAAQQAGVTIRARIVSVSADKKSIRLRHNAVPGLLGAGERDFAAGPALPADVRGGLDVLAHLDEVSGAWTLLDYRVLVLPAAPGSQR